MSKIIAIFLRNIFAPFIVALAIAPAVGPAIAAFITGDGGLTSIAPLQLTGANQVDQRNGTNTQAFRVYNTYTSATSGEYLEIKYNGSSRLDIMSQKGSGGGTIRDMFVGITGDYASSATLFLSGGSTGAVNISSLLAVAASASVNGWNIATSANGAHMLPYPTNTRDVGSSTQRVRSVYIGTALSLSAVAFSSAPGSPIEGMLVAFTDSSTATWGDTITGGGSNHVLGYYNGTNWTVMGK